MIARLNKIFRIDGCDKSIGGAGDDGDGWISRCGAVFNDHAGGNACGLILRFTRGLWACQRSIVGGPCGRTGLCSKVVHGSSLEQCNRGGYAGFRGQWFERLCGSAGRCDHHIDLNPDLAFGCGAKSEAVAVFIFQDPYAFIASFKGWGGQVDGEFHAFAGSYILWHGN